MGEQALLLALVVMALVGALLLATLVAERRRRGLRERLANIAATGRATTESGTGTIRLSAARARRGPGILPAALRQRFASAFEATGDRITPVHLIVGAILAAALSMAFTGGVLGFGPSAVLGIAALVALAAPFVILRQAQRRYQRRFLDLFPDALDLIVRAVKSGLPALDAMGAAAQEIPDPVGREFQRTIDEMRIGVDMDEALKQAADRIRVPDFRFFVVSLALQRQTGGGLAETLSNLSTVIRRRKELRLKARALSAEAKASAAVLGALPVFSSAALAVLAPQYVALLFTDARGRLILGIALLSLFIGFTVMSMIIRKSLR
jgi:tight adherence protein B